MKQWHLASNEWHAPAWPVPAGIRLIVDNDFAGDPDDLFHLAHQVLCPEADLLAVICSHLRDGDPAAPYDSMEQGHNKALRLFEVMGLADTDRLVQGAPHEMLDRHTPIPTAGTQAIIDAALGTSSDKPLYVACGGGLTDIASAWLLCPEIADHLTVVWIGGPDHPGLPDQSGSGIYPEYNQMIDLTAAQVVFNDSNLPLWQVPRAAYRQCVVSQAELSRRLKDCGSLGEHLMEALRVNAAEAANHYIGRYCASTYVIGDQPLLSLTCLQTFYEPDTGSSDYVIRPRTSFTDAGEPRLAPGGAPARVYTRIDTRLMFEDMFARFEAFADWQGSTPSL
ncbi:MAG: nucleoside hydrolase [Propionibacteriaceae bacterium]|nr:nucleoside hydrolase [Propionibacteriaceae bacterium]